jgi:hypothetical protein
VSSDAPLQGVPAPLQEWIQDFGGEDPGGTDASQSVRAIEALQRALALPDRDRAYALLASDALLTLECERAALADNPERVLLELLDSLGKLEPR